MKKVFSVWSWAMLLALCVGFSSCSDDDDEGGSNSTKVEIYVDGELLPVDSDDYFRILGNYNIPYEYFNFTIVFKANYSSHNMMLFGFEIPKADLVKVGDDITKYDEFSIKLGSMLSTKYNSGAITVTKHDLKNQILSFEFKDVSVTTTNLNTSQKTNHVITGKVTLSYETN